MSVDSFDGLLAHKGHSVEVGTYGDPVMNVAVECMDCSEVLMDFDRAGRRGRRGPSRRIDFDEMRDKAPDVPVFVPKSVLLGPGGIDSASGVVGTIATNPLRVILDFEGNRYRYDNIRNFADRVYRAYDRHLAGYPTVARMVTTLDTVRQVGTFDGGTVTVSDPSTLAAWLGTNEVDPADLKVTR